MQCSQHSTKDLQLRLNDSIKSLATTTVDVPITDTGMARWSLSLLRSRRTGTDLPAKEEAVSLAGAAKAVKVHLFNLHRKVIRHHLHRLLRLKQPRPGSVAPSGNSKLLMRAIAVCRTAQFHSGHWVHVLPTRIGCIAAIKQELGAAKYYAPARSGAA